MISRTLIKYTGRILALFACVMILWGPSLQGSHYKKSVSSQKTADILLGEDAGLEEERISAGEKAFAFTPFLADLPLPTRLFKRTAARYSQDLGINPAPIAQIPLQLLNLPPPAQLC